MKLIVNGETAEVPEGLTVAGLLNLRQQLSTVAVAVNQHFVPRTHHAQHVLKAGDQVEIVAPMQGG